MHMNSTHSSSSAAESTMEDSSNHHRHSGRHKNRHHRHSTPTTTVSTTTGESDGEVEECEPEVWASMNRSFRQVQSVLDRNRALIQQVNENQQSRIPNNMVKNVSLIQELNGNISKVVSLYSDLNSNFTDACQHRSKNSSSTRRGDK